MKNTATFLEGKVRGGVLNGTEVRYLFDHAQKHGYAIPAINCTSSSTVIAALTAAKNNNSPIIIQFSQGGSKFFAGKGMDDTNLVASAAGAIAGAHFVRSIAGLYQIPIVLHTDHCAEKLLPWLDAVMDADEEFFKMHGEPLFSSHMVDFSELPNEQNIGLTEKYMIRAAKIDQWLEMEIGITGGEEDGVNNENVDKLRLYTKPEEVYEVYETLSKHSSNFSIAAAFGNVHGVYKPGNVQLKPEMLSEHQNYASSQLKNGNEKPLYLVFHGGSGSADHEFQNAIKYGVVKVNIDTDTQYAYLQGVRDYVLGKKDYLMSPVGNPDGADKPNKKYFDPRVWIYEGEKTMSKRVEQAFKIFKTIGKLNI